MSNSNKLKLLVVLALSLPSLQVLAKSETQTAIEAQNRALSAAVAKGDAGDIAALYARKAEALPPNGPIAKGRKAIRKLWQSALDSGVKGIKLETTGMFDHGDAADEEGRYTVFGANGKPMDTGKYIVIWKRDDGVWRLYRDIWNSNTPLAVAK